MFEGFPNLHPLVIHFPIVLILMSAVFQGFLLFRYHIPIRWATMFIMLFAFLGSLAASLVFHAMPEVEALTPAGKMIFAEHEKFADYTMWFSGITFVTRAVVDVLKIYKKSIELLIFVLAVTAAIFLSLAGHRGAQLVYIEGVGPKGNMLMKGDHNASGGGMNMEGGAKHNEMKMDSTAVMDSIPKHP